MLLAVVGKSNSTPPQTPTGWTLLSGASKDGGSGSLGADAGQLNTSVFYRIIAGGEGTVSGSELFPSGVNSATAQTHLFRRSGGTGWTLAATGGAQATTFTGDSNPGIASGDVVFCAFGYNTDSNTATASALTATGLTVTDNFIEFNTNNAGFDSALGGSYHQITAGTASSAPVLDVTGDAGTTRGSAIFFRMRETSSGYSLTADQGSFSLTGNSTGLVKASLLSASQGSFSLSGQTTNLLRGFNLTCTVGSFTLNGQDVTLTYSPVGGYTLSASSGSFSFTGNDSGLLVSRAITLSSGTYSLQGIDSNLLLGLKLTASNGTYTFTGSDTGLFKGFILDASNGTFSFTGIDAGLVRALLLGATTGTFSLDGRSAALTYSGEDSSETTKFVMVFTRRRY